MKYKSIGELCEVKGGKRLPKGDVLTEKDTGHPYLRITDYSTGFLNSKSIKFITQETFGKISKYIINKNDIFISIVGTIGIIDVIKDSFDGASLTENAAKIKIIDRSVLNYQFLAYYLKSPQGQSEILSRAVGSTQLKLALTRIKDIPVPMFSLEEQEMITGILAPVDSKIELNNQIIKTLEETATTLFNHWFIDFEFPDKNGNPYKSSGGKMIESELGEIPEGWEVKNLGDLVTFEYGKTLKKENRLNGKYPVYGSGGVVGYHNEYLITGPSIIVGRKGTVGSIYYSEENSFPIDTTFWIKPKLENLSMGFTLLILKNQDFSNLISDSAVPGLNRNVAYQNKVIFPTEKIMLEFNAINDSLLKNINSLKKENETLKELRDTLLPKLLSGEIELE